VKGSILLVEDTEDDIELTRRALKKNKLTNPLVIARDGQEALDYLLGNGASPKEPDELPAIVLLDLVEGYTSGANSYIRKPVDFHQFTEAVRQLGLYWLVLNEPPPHVG
jgi:CheY-like chemotaxis protein